MFGLDEVEIVGRGVIFGKGSESASLQQSNRQVEARRTELALVIAVGNEVGDCQMFAILSAAGAGGDPVDQCISCGCACSSARPRHQCKKPQDHAQCSISRLRSAQAMTGSRSFRVRRRTCSCNMWTCFSGLQQDTLAMPCRNNCRLRATGDRYARREAPLWCFVRYADIRRNTDCLTPFRCR